MQLRKGRVGVRVGGAVVARARSTRWTVRQRSMALTQISRGTILQTADRGLRASLTAIMHHLHGRVVDFGILDALVDGSGLATSGLRRTQRRT